MTTERFDNQFALAHCELLTECDVLDLYGYNTARQCEAETTAHESECDEFSKQDAMDCIGEVESMTCVDLASDTVPKACERACSP